MQTFTPFPLRARGLVEQFDAAIKLYKQYFWVLLGWSAIVVGASVLGAIIPMGGMASFFLTPMAIGSAVCCVAAAVRGQPVEFGQIWKFTQPRYWPILGLHLLASLVGSLIIAVVIGIIVAIVIGGVYAFGKSSGAVQITIGVLAFLVFGTIVTILGTVFVSWMGLVPIVVCMEHDRRNTSALGRAYDLLRGHWGRITTLMALVGLAMMALLTILASTAVLLVGINNIKDMVAGRGGSDGAAFVLALIAFGGSYTLMWMLWTPLYYLILTVFYLDVRVRQEAIDLEWTAHATAPPPSTPAEAPVFNMLPTATPEYSNPTTFTPPHPTYRTERLDDYPSAVSDAPFETSTQEPSTPSPTAPEPVPDDNGAITPSSTPSPAEPPRPQW